MPRQTKFQKQLESDLAKGRAKMRRLIRAGAKPQAVTEFYKPPPKKVSQMTVAERRKAAKEVRAFIGRQHQFHVTREGGVLTQATFRKLKALQRKVDTQRAKYDSELYGDTGFTSAEMRAIQGETMYGKRAKVEPNSERGAQKRIERLQVVLSPEYMARREAVYRENVLKAIRGSDDKELTRAVEGLTTAEMIRLSHVSDFTTLVFGYDSGQAYDPDDQAERVSRLYDLIR